MNNNKTKKIIRYTFLLGLFLVVLGTSYALFTITLTGNKLTRIKSANVSLQLLDENNNSIEKTDNNSYEYEINLDKAVPVTDEEGLTGESFIFKLKNNGTIPVKYQIYLNDIPLAEGENRLDNKYVRYQLVKNNNIEYFRNLKYTVLSSGERLLDGGIINNNSTIQYQLKIWLDKDADNNAINKAFDTTLKVEGVPDSGFKIKSDTFADTLVKKGIVGSVDKVLNLFDESDETDGLYEYIDENGIRTYVYRGVDPNNYVTFGGSTWRILRIEEGGAVKLIKNDLLNFDSNLVAASYENYKHIKFNTEYFDNSYRYEGSNVEAYINEWFADTMQSYNSKIKLNNYCSDTSKSYVDDSLLPYNISTQIFKEKDLYVSDNNSYVKPRIACNTSDIYRSSVALMTMDEYILSGGQASSRIGGYSLFSNGYLVPKGAYETEWTMSPVSIWTNTSTNDKQYFVGKNNYNTGITGGNYVTSNNAVRPVITLKSNIVVSSGSGTSDNPYVIQ